LIRDWGIAGLFAEGIRMRLLIVAVVLAAGLGSAAVAQPVVRNPRVPAAPPTTEAPQLPTIEEGIAAAQAMDAKLKALDEQIATDELRMTQLRDAELAVENQRLRAIRPALPFHGKLVR
jgi:hypothetical protein